MLPQFRFSSLIALLFVIVLSGCSAKQKPHENVYSGSPCRDVATMPQDLNAYAHELGVNKPLASSHDQMTAAARQKQTFFRPWQASEPSNWVRQSLEKNFNMRPDKAFATNNRPFPADLWNSIEANSNKDAYGMRQGPGITLRHSNLRAMPTREHFYLDPELPGEGYPFDYFQHTSLHAGTPVYICNISRDGQWLLVESALTSGWIPVADVGETDASFMERWQSRPLAALVRDKVSIGGTNNHIGTLLPLAGHAPTGRGQTLNVLFPVPGPSGTAAIDQKTLPPDAAVAVPLAMTPGEVAKVGNEMMGQAYGWGGLDEKRDCSALTHDIVAPFGFFLPRNSAAQSKVGATLDLAGLQPDEKERAIIREAIPFASLIWFRGHIGLYAGQYNGKPVMFHNMWGLRTQGNRGDCTGRAIVGKAVVTSLSPGEERPDLCPSGHFLPRIEKVAVLPSGIYGSPDDAVAVAP